MLTELAELQTAFPENKFYSIPTDDIRDKEARGPSKEVVGLIDSEGKLKAPYRSDISLLIQEINQYHIPNENN